MKTAIKKSNDPKTKREKLPKDEIQKPQDEKNKNTSYSTPRNLLKSSTSDIYGRIKKDSIQNSKAPKKQANTTNKNSYVSPMKGLLQSSPSSTSYSSSSREKTKNVTQKKVDAKTTPQSSRSVKDFNVTINSPVVKKRNLDKEKKFIKEVSKKVTGTPILSTSKVESQNIAAKVEIDRKRTKTRTLRDDEVKVLTAEAVDNNLEMFNLTRKLSAAPKAYFIDLEDKAKSIAQTARPKTPSDEEVSYEDDFESYESDFDSYHSSTHSGHSGSDDKDDKSDEEEGDDVDKATIEEIDLKDVKDDEKMLDSGSFHLRDQRSATKTKQVLGFISETGEVGEDKPTSLTDEGFLEMSCSSAVSSMRTVHTEVLDRPVFLDFTKSQENKRKKRICERLKKRASDLLAIITLHEMSYSLYEMKPISYELYMATFGKSNYQQKAVQTFDDGITEEIQTEEIECEEKWTQHPVEFSKNDICIVNERNERKYHKYIEDYTSKFSFLTTDVNNTIKNNMINMNENYKTDPLRIYLEQKDGVGPNEMMPYQNYISKFKNNDYNIHRLSKFLKKFEKRVCDVLNNNSGDTGLLELKTSKYPFSKGYYSISTKNIVTENLSFLNNTKISQVYLSETENNLLLTVHSTHNKAFKKCTICLWDINIARREPTKILTAIDNVAIGKFRGATDGYFIAALEDCSIHLWDLSEEAMWRPDVASAEKSKELVEVNGKELTPVERDREWNKTNSQFGMENSNTQCPLQSCAYTNSACNMSKAESSNTIVGLEFIGDQVISEEGRRILGQVAALQSFGIITIWSIIQSKNIPPDIGKAYWSKMKLEKCQTIILLDHIDILNKYTDNENFNLNAAKKRLNGRKQEKILLKNTNSRPKLSADVEIDRPNSAASVKNKKMLPVQNNFGRNWESGILCYDLKVVFWQNSYNYLVGKNCGEVLCCKKTLGAIKITRFCVAADVSSITCLEVSPHKLPYYLAATDTGTISICSLNQNRVLLTLDCRNIPTPEMEKCLSDSRGRYMGTVSNRPSVNDSIQIGVKPIGSISWSHINPCCIFATLDGSVVTWDLCHSDIYAKCVNNNAAVSCTAGENTLVLVSPDGDIHIHKLTNENKTKEYLILFNKYVKLL